ncbi:MAG: aldehyde reductase [Caldilineaceae bacterium]|nr:aldehyde reductase [Caldilineaceae bacterium]
MSGELVLVTGGSGFVGAHSIVQLLNAGYRVRTTVRSLAREADVRAMLKEGGAQNGDLSFMAADLTDDANWPTAVAGCDYVLHVASPFPFSTPKDEDDVIIPARDGTLRVLRAARDAGVKRVVMTSSFVAIAYGHRPTTRPFSEEMWTDIHGDVNPYMKSKTLAEQAAWDFIAREGDGLELAVVNPVGIFGPVLGRDFAATIEIMQLLLNGALPAVPRISVTMVDVRDVVDLHLRAMTHPAANGERLIAASDKSITLQELVYVLKRELGPVAQRVPTRPLPDWLVRLVARFSASAQPLLRELGQVRHASNAKAHQLLDWQPRSNEETIVATAESLVRFGLVKNR